MCREAIIIERTLDAALQTHYARELRQLRDKVNRLESQVRLLAQAVRRRDMPLRETAGRTRPRVVS